MKNCFAEFCELCVKYYCKTIKFRSVPGCAGQPVLLEGAVKLILPFKNSFLSDS